MSQYPAVAAAGAPYTATTTGFATEPHAQTTATTTALPAPAPPPLETRGKHVHTSKKPFLLIPLLLLAWLSWGCYTAGLAALQNQCNDGQSAIGTAAQNTAYLGGVSGFSATVLPCSKVYRWSWFIMAFEFVVLLATSIAVMLGRLWHARLAMLSMFAVATLLFMLMTESSLTIFSVNPWYEGGTWRHRANVFFAGAICTVFFNIAIILAMGIDNVVDTTAQATEGYGHGHAKQPTVGASMV